MNRDEAIAVLQDVAGGLNDGHARWPVPELGAVIDYLKAEPEPFIWIKVEGGMADFGGDIDRVEVRIVDFDVSEETSDPEELVSMIGNARRIPDRLAELPHDDNRWLDRTGIIESLTEALQRLVDDGDYDGAYDEYLTEEVRA